ncbi:MAG: heme-binding protein [Pseudomonadota bacterium]
MTKQTKRWTLGAVALGLAILVFASTRVLAIEEPAYRVTDRFDDVEIRAYEPYRVASLIVEGSFKAAGNRAFRPLVGYISGRNATNTEYAMTAPVTQQAAGQQWRIEFVLPAGTTLADLPAPENAQIELLERPARTVAAVRYSGAWSQDRYQHYEQSLLQTLQANGFTRCGAPVWARFNSPFALWFMRRNEVQVDVAKGACPAHSTD